MANRRMFSNTITDSDAFLDMPLSTQALYFHLAMKADDEGFLNGAKRIQRTIGASDDDMRLLIAKRFILPFESGVVVIKHWRIHNYIQSDRFHPTVHQEEKARLKVKPNKAYTLENGEPLQDVYALDTECIQEDAEPDSDPIAEKSEKGAEPLENGQCIQDVSRLEAEVRLGKVRLGIKRDNIYTKNGEKIAEDLIGYLNEVAGRSFRADTPSTLAAINDVLNAGWSPDEIKMVFKAKTDDWKDTDMAKYIRPKTLLGENFEAYLQQAIFSEDKHDERMGRILANAFVAGHPFEFLPVLISKQIRREDYEFADDIFPYEQRPERVEEIRRYFEGVIA